MRIIILGPTASGKTELSLHLAEALNTSIISADSRQCYKHLDIGTAKPSQEVLARVPHYNISILDLDEEDSAMKFRKRADLWEQDILQHSEHVVYAGGSTLHLQSLIQPFNEVPDANANNIALLDKRIDEEGIETVYEMLGQIDPAYIPKMDGMNRQRIIRALDVWMQTGKPFSSFHHHSKIQPDNNTLVFGLQHPRDELYRRINLRVDSMIKRGLIKEVEYILKKHSSGLQSLNTVGYKEIIQYLQGNYSLGTATAKIKTNTRRYAKRQLTWFKRWEFIQWLPAESKSVDELSHIILSIIKKQNQ